ncbi:hypothetical protein SRABI26_02682 [Arthrobacter sp. Bi26]|uniref:hypothetical protein n=1 Tax=Arthrobacter sp. Bi26 TaxID=2822350 RepID=UPI001DD9D290|nr:hypothetical protein [Arthrobacter sp. Bi26]CAH0232400.1 hypothetical protein SRABI26_02682 [Arthrobacter sp. Bi26]
MSQIPGFESAQRAWEAMEPPTDVDQCEDGDCDECMECLAAIAQDQADAYAEGQWEEHRLESRYGG